MKSNYIMVSIDDLNLHELSKLTPEYTKEEFLALKISIEEEGLNEPIVLYRKKVVDGRHRLRACKELNMAEIKTTSLRSDMSISEVENLITDVYEKRRHQTPTQKAIFAYKNMIRAIGRGERATISDIATKYGTNRNMISRVKKLLSIAPPEIIEALWHGKKINIGTKNSPMKTDSLYSLINFYKKNNKDSIEIQLQEDFSSDLTDDEIEAVKNMEDVLIAQLTGRQLSLLAKRLCNKQKKKDNDATIN